MSEGDIIAGVSCFFSLAALWMSYHAFHGSVRHASRPVLVFGMVSTYRWRIQNVGTGPAINIVVADYHPQRQADSITKCYPIAAGGHIDLTWLRAGYELGVVYTDIFGTKYSTTCLGNTNAVSARNELGDLIPDTEQWVQQLEGRPERGGLRTRDLHGKSAAELDLMRNEIYARHGYIFGRKDLHEYFSRQPWYQPKSDKHSEIEAQLTPLERYEAMLILHFQRSFNLLVDQSLASPSLGDAPPTLGAAPLQSQASTER